MVETIAILGAGAMGTVYASRFYDLDPACVSLVASGERYHRLKRDGLIINQQHYAIPVISPQDEARPADLILVALKHYHLPTALPDIRKLVGDNTVILSVMNGLDSEAIIAEQYGTDKVLYCIAVGIDAQRSENVIHYSKIGSLFFGEAENIPPSARVLRIQHLLNRANIPNETPADMMRMLWWKFMINVGINQSSAILRAPYGVFQTDQHAQAIMEAAMREVITLAQAAGVNLVMDDIPNWYKVLNTLHPLGKTSLLQDIEAGRITEVDVFAGKVVELGNSYGIPTPVNELLLHAIKVIQQDGK
ncbi:MAG TPA: ketopantoate reductase family protein [Aggregatilineaceae bacterium]|nr:ketopantoate reductase family protein [Aggregatilineaceae bacterium]